MYQHILIASLHYLVKYKFLKITRPMIAINTYAAHDKKPDATEFHRAISLK